MMVCTGLNYSQGTERSGDSQWSEPKVFWLELNPQHAIFSLQNAIFDTNNCPWFWLPVYNTLF
jgi:hypothetical protein